MSHVAAFFLSCETTCRNWHSAAVFHENDKQTKGPFLKQKTGSWGGEHPCPSIKQFLAGDQPWTKVAKFGEVALGGITIFQKFSPLMACPDCKMTRKNFLWIAYFFRKESPHTLLLPSKKERVPPIRICRSLAWSGEPVQVWWVTLWGYPFLSQTR